MTTMIEPPPAAAASGCFPRATVAVISRPTGTPATVKRLALAVVGLHQGTDACSAGVASLREAVPMPPLKPWQTMPVPPPTLPSATGPGFAASSAANSVLGRDVKAVDVVQEAVVRLAHDR